MDLFSTLSFFFIMLALAAMPSASVALVVTRSATLGIPNGIAAAGGIVLGDLVFVALALLGMSVLSEILGALFSVVKYLGGAYLIWVGWSLLRQTSSANEISADSSRSTLLASTLSGLALTLGDIKAIVFYASLFPNLFDLSGMASSDVLLVCGVTILTVGGVKALYAVTARMVVERLRGTAANRHTRTVAGGALISMGSYLIAKN